MKYLNNKANNDIILDKDIEMDIFGRNFCLINFKQFISYLLHKVIFWMKI